MANRTIPDHTAMVDSILAVYDRATPAQCEAGRFWYDDARAIANVIADASGIAVDRIVFAIAALSPRNPWRWNIADAYAFAMARAEGRTMPRATTFKRNWLRAWQALGQEGDPWVTEAPKVRAFVQCIMGDAEAVVVDTWAYRVAVGEKPHVVRPKDYQPIAHAFNVAANLRGELPAHMQAITWLVAQTEGLASHRTGRHDLAFKAGTPDQLKELL